MEKSFFILFKKFLQLAIDEIKAIVTTYDKKSTFYVISNMLIVESFLDWRFVFKRATFVKTAGKIISKNFPNDLNNKFIDNSKSFALRSINLSSKIINIPNSEKEIGMKVAKLFNLNVNLNDPDLIFFFIITDKHDFLGLTEKLPIQKRLLKPYVHPHQLDWKFCRLMLNLAQVKENQTICDPFCGTGTILLEAKLLGLNSIGIDFDKQMYEMSIKNLQKNNLNSKVIHADFSEIKNLKNYDAIVCDIPYGTASKTSSDPSIILTKLMNLIPKNKKIVLMCKKGSESNLKFNFTKKYEIFRHKSLTRIILIR